MRKILLKRAVLLVIAAMAWSMPGVAEPLEGDTVRLSPKDVARINAARPLERFDAPYESVVFVPRGEWVAGLSASYSQQNAKDYDFFVFQNIDGDSYDFKVSPMVGYAFADDLVAGLKFAYSRSRVKLDKGEVALDSDPVATADNLYMLGHNYYGTAFMRNYFSMGSSRRFGFFSEVQLQLGGGQAKGLSGSGDALTGNYDTSFSVSAGVVPGIAVFLNNYSALEMTVGVLGYSYNYTKSVRDRIYDSHRSWSYANFKINLFSVTFGVSFYI